MLAAEGIGVIWKLHVGAGTLHAPGFKLDFTLASSVISVVPAAWQRAAFPFRAPPSFQRTPLGFGPAQAPLPSSIGSLYAGAVIA
jgi:hypothetical protein